jgi:hypothetical protein
MRQSQFRFTLQQGFEAADASDGLYAALMVQPRIIGGLVALGVLFHSAWLFLVLSAVLWWSTLAPALNPFDVFANHLVARPRGIPPLGIAPAPRRFAQGMSATVMFAIGAALLVGAERTAWLLEGLMVGAVVAVVFGDFCEGAYLYYLVRRSARPRVPVGVTTNGRWSNRRVHD